MSPGAKAQSSPVLDQVGSRDIYNAIARRDNLPQRVAPSDVIRKKLDLSDVGEAWMDLLGRNTEHTESLYDEGEFIPVLPKQGPTQDEQLDSVNPDVLKKTLILRTKALYPGAHIYDYYSVMERGQEVRKGGVKFPQEERYAASADAVAMILDGRLLQKTEGGDYIMTTAVYGDSLHLCDEQQFWKQPCADSTGSAFLISPTQVCTAAHCVPDLKIDAGGLGRLRLVFGYRMESSRIPKLIRIKADNVFEIGKIAALHPSSGEEGQEWAVLELKRPCLRQPLKLGGGKPRVDDVVYGIGHPNGLPVKISTNGRVQQAKQVPEGCFFASVDAYHGSSGCPVIDDATHEVQGLLVKGNDDFEPIETGLCKRSVLITEVYAGELISSIEPVRAFLENPPPPSK